MWVLPADYLELRYIFDFSQCRPLQTHFETKLPPVHAHEGCTATYEAANRIVARGGIVCVPLYDWQLHPKPYSPRVRALVVFSS